MSGQPATIKNYAITSFAGGMNTKSAETALAPNQMSFIGGYRVFDDFLTSSGKQTTVDTIASGGIQSLVNWRSSSLAEVLLGFSSAGTIYSYTSAFARTDVTGAVTLTNGFVSSTIFNQRLFICNGTNAVIRFDDLVSSNPAFTGPSPDNSVLKQVCSYKNRLYFAEKDSNSIWYGDVDAITGALTEVDLSSVFDISSTISFAASWSYNQGVQSEEVFVIVSVAGEVLIYSGDSPEAANWQLTGRTKIYPPQSFRSFVKLGGDILIYTNYGVVSLSSAVSQGSNPATLFKVSNNIENSLNPTPSTSSFIVSDTLLPFVYANNANFIYGINFQTGAWSLVCSASSAVTCVAVAFNKLVFVQASSPPAAILVTIDSTNQSAVDIVERTIRTGWLNFGSPLQKRISLVRIITNPVLGSDTYTLTISTDFNLTSAASSSSETQTTSSIVSDYKYTEFAPGVVGKYFKLEITCPSTSNPDDFYSIEIFYEEGGAY